MIDNYKDLPLSLFLRIDKVLTSEAEDIDKQVAVIALLSGCEEADILAMPVTDYASLAGKAAFLSEPCPSVPAAATIQAEGFTLVPVKDFTRITTAQYVDFQTFARDIPQSLPRLLSCLLVPEGHSYNEGYDMAAVHRAVEALPLPVAMGLSAFFFASLRESIAASLASLAQMPGQGTKAASLAAKTREILASLGL